MTGAPFALTFPVSGTALAAGWFFQCFQEQLPVDSVIPLIKSTTLVY